MIFVFSGKNLANALVKKEQRSLGNTFLKNKFMGFMGDNRIILPRKGLEPPHLAASEPKSDVSTSFTTWAYNLIIYKEERL